MSFENLGLNAELARAVSDKGYTTPTPIQAQAIPLILEGRDLMGGAQTGTGKTAGFTLPVLQRLMEGVRDHNKRRPLRALVLTPTRELAAQVAESVVTYGRHLPLRSTAVYGGVSINPQKKKLIRGVDILVATPGRLLDHVSQRSVDLSKVDMLILDEADRMLDMGFIHDIRKVQQLLPKQRQTLLFSATFSNDIKKLANDMLNKPALVEVARKNTTAESVTQVIHPVDRQRKRELLSYLIGDNNWQQVLVFCRTKHGCDRLAKQLIADGIRSAAIHGNKSQGARTRALADFKQGNIRVLVATDIAARGLDIDQLPHVVNFDLPNQADDYVHRIGRTGRAGNEGEAMSLVCIDELELLHDIEGLIKAEIPSVVIDGFEVDPTIKAEPINRGGGNKQRNNKNGFAARKRQGGGNGGNRNNKGNGSGNSKSKRKGPPKKGSGNQGGQSGNSSGRKGPGKKRTGGNSGGNGGGNRARNSNQGGANGNRRRHG